MQGPSPLPTPTTWSTDSKVLARALTYARSLGALVIGHPQDPGLSTGPPSPRASSPRCAACPACHPLAERMGLDRDLALVEMTGVALSRRPDHHGPQPCPRWPAPRQNGLDVTAGVSIHHLTLNDLDVGDYRTFFKLTPPLRAEEDRLAVVEAVAVGPDRHHLVLPHARRRGIEAPAVRGGRRRGRRAGNLAARGDAPLSRRRT